MSIDYAHWLIPTDATYSPDAGELAALVHELTQKAWLGNANYILRALSDDEGDEPAVPTQSTESWVTEQLKDCDLLEVGWFEVDAPSLTSAVLSGEGMDRICDYGVSIILTRMPSRPVGEPLTYELWEPCDACARTRATVETAPERAYLGQLFEVPDPCPKCAGDPFAERTEPRIPPYPVARFHVHVETTEIVTDESPAERRISDSLSQLMTSVLQTRTPSIAFREGLVES